MKFLKIITQLIDNYGSNLSFTDNDVCLLGPHNPPHIAEHFIYAAMPNSTMQHLIQSYRGHFPDDLQKLYSYANGLDLFRTMRKVSAGICLPASKISIFGMPIIADRKHIEPFNICLEDLNRLSGTPKSWLKFGCLRDIFHNELTNEYDLYVDTIEGKAYQVERNNTSLSIIRAWRSIDDCLCSLLKEASQEK